MAPNMVTLIGLFGNFAALALILFYDTAFKEELPLWASVFICLMIFFYQTMDAIDGKQARRTGTSGPLGQLFDHGCDAIATPVLLIFSTQTFILG